jgi:nucleotide-binding universal stress UspA family protein
VAIARYAKGAGAAIIAAGTHTATGLHRVAVGSVCAGLVHRAPCPVLVHRTLG